jgi:hypothetical protein
MKSQKEDSLAEPQSRNEFEDDEQDHLYVPASPARIVLGLAAMLGGLLSGAIWNKPWVGLVGFVIFCLSPLIMLRRPES